MHNQQREAQPYEDCQAKLIQEFGWTSQGMDWGWGQGIKSHHTQRRLKEFVFLKTNFSAPVYQEIFEHFMLPSADQLFKDADFIFQQDLAPAHTAKSTSHQYLFYFENVPVTNGGGAESHGNGARPVE